MIIRDAVADDASEIATVHVRSWKVAYPGLIPQSYLDALTPQSRLGSWQERLSSVPDVGSGTLVLVVDHDANAHPQCSGDREAEILGFTSYGPAEDDAAVGEIYTLYLDPSVWGGGWGERLLDAAISRLAAAGMSQASLWVLGTNERARRFYERLGWKPDGTTKLHDWKAFTATDVRYRFDLE